MFMSGKLKIACDGDDVGRTDPFLPPPAPWTL